MELSTNSLEIEMYCKQMFGRKSFDQNFCQVKMWKGRMMTNAVLDCQRLTDRFGFLQYYCCKTEIEAAAE